MRAGGDRWSAVTADPAGTDTLAPSTRIVADVARVHPQPATTSTRDRCSGAAHSGRARPRPVAAVRALASELPRSRLVVLDGVGHFPHREAPDTLQRLFAQGSRRDSLSGQTSGRTRLAGPRPPATGETASSGGATPCARRRAKSRSLRHTLTRYRGTGFTVRSCVPVRLLPGRSECSDAALLRAPRAASGALQAGVGYRMYRPDAVRIVRFVMRAQELGFGLREAETLLGLAAAGPGELRGRARAGRGEDRRARSADRGSARDA